MYIYTHIYVCEMQYEKEIHFEQIHSTFINYSGYL